MNVSAWSGQSVQCGWTCERSPGCTRPGGVGAHSGLPAWAGAPPSAGAGKTYTMLGMDAEPGVYLRTLSDLFRAIEMRGSMDWGVSMSYLEVSCPPPRCPVHSKPLCPPPPRYPSQGLSALGASEISPQLRGP